MGQVVSIFASRKLNLLPSKKTGYDSKTESLKSSLSVEDRNHLNKIFGVKNGAN